MLSLLAFWYMIEHVPGDVSVWGDLLSRWGAGKERIEDGAVARVARLAVGNACHHLKSLGFLAH